MISEPTTTYLDDEYVFVWDDLDVKIVVERFREEGGDLKADTQPASAAGNGSLPPEKMNLSSARSIKTYANTLGGHGLLDAETWFECLSKCAKLASIRYREGEPSLVLSEIKYAERPRFLVEPFLEMDSRSLLFGDGGASKSMHALALAASVAAGKSIIPGTTVHAQGAVLYLDWEDKPETHAERLVAICDGAGISVPDNIYYMRRVGSLHESVREIRKEVGRRGAIFVIVDSVGAACGGDPEKAADVIRAFDAMRALGVTIQAIHHVTKDQKDKTKPFGSVYAPNLVRLSWRLDREPGRNGEMFVRATNYKGNNVGVIEQRSHTVWFDADDDYRLHSVRFGQSSAIGLYAPTRTDTDNSLRNRMAALFMEYGPLDIAAVATTLSTAQSSARSKLSTNKDWFTKHEDGRWDVLEAIRSGSRSGVDPDHVRSDPGGPPIGAPERSGSGTERRELVPPWNDEAERLDSLAGL